MRSQRLYCKLVVCICLIASFSGPVFAGDGVFPSSGHGGEWVAVAAGFALLLHCGQLLLRAGRAGGRVADEGRKLLLGILVAGSAFSILGLPLAFGRSAVDVDAAQVAVVLFQVMVCCAAATIATGAVAGAIGLRGYLVLPLLMSGVIYPGFAHWSSGDLLHPSATAFLARLDFVDFAGGTAIHATAGWMALAACMVLGPTGNRWGSVAETKAMRGSISRQSVVGALLLFAGLSGLGTIYALNSGREPLQVVANVATAGAAGCIAALLVGLRREKSALSGRCMTGAFGGLAAVSAGCGLLDMFGAVITGVAGAVVAIAGNEFVARRLNAEDATGAVGIHAFAGVAGALLLALVVPGGQLPVGDRLEQLWIQAVGAGINFYWSFGLSYLLLRLVRPFIVLQSKPEGNDAVPEVAQSGFDRVEDALACWLEGKAEGRPRLPVMAGDESARLTELFNRLMDRVETEEHERREQLRVRGGYDEAERVAALAKATFEAIMIHRNGIVVDGNEELAKLVGRPLPDLVGRSIFEFLRDGKTILVSEIITRNDDARHEISIALPNGEEIPVAARGRDIVFRGEKARVGCFVDLRERKQAEQRIRYLAQHDPLTGLPNRVLFTESLDAIVQEDERSDGCGVAVIDIDRFKDINDIHGHQAGDAVIREVSARLSAVAGPYDIVARLGGDEFAAILGTGSSVEELEAFGGRVLAAMAAPIEIAPGRHVNVTVSIGAALCPEHAQDTDALIGCADIALFHAKTSGRNACRPFRRGMNDLIEKRRALEADLELALCRGEFELYLQPRVAVEEAAISGYEALLRWNHPVRGMVSPADFIPVAEASGKIIQLGEWVLTEAVRLLEHIDGHISVNVSPLQFRHSDFVANLAHLLHRTGADPKRIELEITESVLIDDDSRALHLLQDLKRMGFAIALDDFGTGYSSLSYLSRYPFDTIKIDRSFVANLSVAESARMIATTIIDLGAGLGMKVVAEGVETMEEALFLGRAGCHELQGYLLGRPAPVAKITKILDQAIERELERMPRRLPEIRGDDFEGGRLRLVNAMA